MAKAIVASAFHAMPSLLRDYELLIDGEWCTFESTDIYRMPNSPILFYAEFPLGEVSVPRDVYIEVRPKKVSDG